MCRRWRNWIRIDLEDANMVVHDRVIDSAVLDSGHVKDLAKSGFVRVRLDVHPFGRRLRRRRAVARPFDRPVGAEEEIAGKDSAADDMRPVSMVDARGIGHITKLHYELVLAILSLCGKLGDRSVELPR